MKPRPDKCKMLQTCCFLLLICIQNKATFYAENSLFGDGHTSFHKNKPQPTGFMKRFNISVLKNLSRASSRAKSVNIVNAGPNT